MEQVGYLFLLVILVIAEDTNYCGLCKGHTMCRYRSPKPSDQCSDYKSADLTSSEEEEILKQHNNIRAHVAKGKEKRGNPGPQPAAINLKPLKWDDELAMIAQRWANQCRFGHMILVETLRFRVGQNVAYIASDNFRNMTKMVMMWYNEVDQFDRRHVTNYKFSRETGHYTQMMWADTKKIGCGAVTHRKSPHGYASFLVCNYGPAGNEQGRSIYRSRQ